MAETASTTSFKPTGVWLEYPGGLDIDDDGLLEEFAKKGGTGIVLEPFITRVRGEVMNLGDHLRQSGL